MSLSAPPLKDETPAPPLLCLSAPGSRDQRVTPDEAAAIRQRFHTELDNDATAATPLLQNGMALDLSCRCWNLECWQELLLGNDSNDDTENEKPLLLERLRPHLRILKIDDTIASLPTAEGLAALEFIATQFSSNDDADQLHTVYLHDNALGTRGIDILRPLLQLPSVRCWTLDNCGLAAADAQTLLDVWRSSNNNNLQSLSLGRNQMGEAGAVVIGELLTHCEQLQSFAYYGCRPLAAGTVGLCRGLAALSHPELLQHLRLEDSDVSDPDAVTALCQCLTRATQLRHLNLRDCALEASGFVAVVEALQEQASSSSSSSSECVLQHWDMGGNGEVGEEGAVALRDFVLANHAPHLTTLILDANEFGDDGVTAVVEGLASSNSNMPKLQMLNLECNEIGRDGALALVQNRIDSLQTLVLSDNLDLPANAARQLQSMYPTVQVEEDLEDDPDWEEEAAGTTTVPAKEVAVDELGAALAQAQI